MRKLALTILTMGLVLTAGHARAQRYDPAFPVCLHVVPWGGGAYYRCSYQTMDQCRASAAGQSCIRNPYYVGAKAASRRHHRGAGSRSYASPWSPNPRSPAAPYNQPYEPYYGASQGYAPGEKEEFLRSVHRHL
ncbi:MAG TPA: DUF3551 domain-containing protein [Bradyrhizobium sp.]|nr:DUF3551 domain-containing protein [Bradyrhizobium sp.]